MRVFYLKLAFAPMGIKLERSRVLLRKERGIWWNGVAYRKGDVVSAGEGHERHRDNNGRVDKR